MLFFADTTDEDYARLLLAVQDTGRRLEEVKRFDMPGFRPRRGYIREMQHYGIIAEDLTEDTPIDYYAADRAYWASLWHTPGTPSPAGRISTVI